MLTYNTFVITYKIYKNVDSGFLFVSITYNLINKLLLTLLYILISKNDVANVLHEYIN